MAREGPGPPSEAPVPQCTVPGDAPLLSPLSWFPQRVKTCDRDYPAYSAVRGWALGSDLGLTRVPPPESGETFHVSLVRRLWLRNKWETVPPAEEGAVGGLGEMNGECEQRSAVPVAW